MRGHRLRLSRGFTLVEVLVVLVITALVSTLLFQALAHIYRLQGRFGDQLTQSQGGAMRADWYRQLLQGLQADYADGRQKFAGMPQQLSGLSATVPSVAGGAAQWVEMKLVASDTAAQGGEVRLRANDRDVVLLAWSARGQAEFAYLDDDGVEQPQWPPLMRSNVLADDKPALAQLPAAILLKLPGLEGRQVLAAVPRGSRQDRTRTVPFGVSPP